MTGASRHDQDAGRFAWPDFGGGALKVPAAMRAPRAAQAAQQEYELGYDAGHKAGLAAAATEIRAMKERLAASIRSIEQTRSRIDDVQRERLVELAHAICRKVLGLELRTDRSVFETFVRHGIERLEASAEAVRVHVNPVDAPLLGPSVDGAAVEPDASVPEGGCSVRTDTCSVDFDPYGLLDQIFAELPRA